MATPRKNRSLDTLWRAFLFRHMPHLFEQQPGVSGGESLGVDDETPLLVKAGTPSAPIRVLGRLYHALQVHGISVADAEEWQLQASLDGTVYANIGSPIDADGFIQVTSGLYGYFRVERSPSGCPPAIADIPAITIQYVGPAAAAALTIADGWFTVVADTVTIVRVRLVDYADYDALEAYLEGLDDGACPPAPIFEVTVDTAGNTDAPTSLTEVSGINIKTAPVALLRGATVLLGSMH